MLCTKASLLAGGTRSLIELYYERSEIIEPIRVLVV